MRTARILIQSTKNKMDRVQTMSDELGYLTSLIKDDRKHRTKPKQPATDQSKATKEARHEYRPPRPAVPGHIVSDKPKKKETTPKIISKLRKLSDGGRMKLIEKTLQKVKDADTKGKNGVSSADKVAESKQTTTHDIVIPRESNFGKKSENGRSDNDHVTAGDETSRSDELPGCLCDCGGNLIVDETAERAIAAKHRGMSRTKSRGPVSKHCCVSHCNSYQGPVILADEDTASPHLPALNVHNLRLPSTRPRSTVDIRKDSIQIVKDSNSINACLNKDDIRNAEKRQFKNWWHHRCACVQEYIRQNEQMESRRPTLKPNKVTLQTTGESSLSSRSGYFVPYEEVSIGYRLDIGGFGMASFPVNIRHLRTIRKQSSRY